jgi:hypothetical protein
MPYSRLNCSAFFLQFGGIMFVLTDTWNAILHIVHGADVITLVLMAVAALGAGFMTMELGAVIPTTIVALIGFFILTFLRAVLLQHMDAGATWTADWHAFTIMPALVLLGYGIIFGVVIAIVSTIRNTVMG